MEEIPTNLEEHPVDEGIRSESESSFFKKVILFMGVELIVALGAVGYFMHIGSSQQLAQSPIEAANIETIDESEVLGLDTELSPSPGAYEIVTPTPSAIPKKKAYKIAIIGDSFEDTMGETGEYLQKSLKEKYPKTEFLIYNYGKGATTVEDGLDSFDKEFYYGIRNYPAIPTLKPDIIIVGSYANNPPNPYDRNSHWLTYTRLVQKAQSITKNVYILAEVAPLRANYGDGPSGVNWDVEYSVVHSGHVVELLENAVGLSKTLNITLIDAYSPTLIEHSKYGKEGTTAAISVSDSIHPSQDGHEFIAATIAETLKLDQ